MFADEIRRAAEAAARVELPAVSAALWKALAAGSVTEAEAEELSGLIEARRIVQTAAGAVSTPRTYRGSRPRTEGSLERRRRWAASGRLPPALAARFTLAEQAVLAVVAGEVAKHGRCTLAHSHVAALAGVSDSTVKRAIRAARDLGVIEVEVRRVSAFRNDTNVVTIISREWSSWLRLRSRGVGVGADPARVLIDPRPVISGKTAPYQGLPKRQRRGDPGGSSESCEAGNPDKAMP